VFSHVWLPALILCKEIFFVTPTFFLTRLIFACKFTATFLLKAGIQAGYGGPAVRTIAWLGRFLAPSPMFSSRGLPYPHQPSFAPGHRYRITGFFEHTAVAAKSFSALSEPTALLHSLIVCRQGPTK
jgi:hypothetical protein